MIVGKRRDECSGTRNRSDLDDFLRRISRKTYDQQGSGVHRVR